MSEAETEASWFMGAKVSASFKMSSLATEM